MVGLFTTGNEMGNPPDFFGYSFTFFIICNILISQLRISLQITGLLITAIFPICPDSGHDNAGLSKVRSLYERINKDNIFRIK